MFVLVIVSQCFSLLTNSYISNTSSQNDRWVFFHFDDFSFYLRLNTKLDIAAFALQAPFLWLINFACIFYTSLLPFTAMTVNIKRISMRQPGLYHMQCATHYKITKTKELFCFAFVRHPIKVQEFLIMHYWTN